MLSNLIYFSISSERNALDSVLAIFSFLQHLETQYIIINNIIKIPSTINQNYQFILISTIY